MNWLILILAGLFEIGWAIGLKYTDGFTRLWPTVGTVLAMAISLGLLGIAMKSLPVGTAYAVWVGVGAVDGHPWHRPAGRAGDRGGLRCATQHQFCPPGSMRSCSSSGSRPSSCMSSPTGSPAWRLDTTWLQRQIMSGPGTPWARGTRHGCLLRAR